MSKRSKATPPTKSRKHKQLAALFDMEPELRHLGGLLTVLSLLGETSDAVDPIALSSLGQAAQASFGSIEESWRELLADARQE